MAVKRTQTKADYEKLSDELKTLYVADGEEYRLDLDGEPDTGALKRAKDHEKALRVAAEKRADEIAAQLEAVTEEKDKKSGNVESLARSYDAKTEKIKSEAEAKIKKLRDYAERHLIDGTTSAAVSEISTLPEALAPLFRQRLRVDYDGEDPRVQVLDAQGQPSAMTVAELKAEFVANKTFSPIMKASMASGGAGNPANRPGGTSYESGKTKDVRDMTDSELRARIDARKK